MNNEKKTTDYPTSQELLAFLSQKLSYPHHPKHIRFLQTHASYVFIVPPFVYKIKKPVNFGFLDFSTLEKRKFYCQREIQLNRLLCPEIYLGVVPITRNDSGLLSFDGRGNIVEYAVKMRMLSGRFFFKKLLKRKRVDFLDIERIVSRLCQFYQQTESGGEISSWGSIEKIKKNTDENFEQTRADIGLTLDQISYDSIAYFTNRFYELFPNLFEKRVRQGWIKNCHGDLHLEHIYIQPDKICIFDRIEFNERFRYIDVASDIAFLAMDLDYNQRPDFSSFFCRRMAESLNDPDLYKFLDFYKSYRAYVRGKVEGMTAKDPLVKNTQKKEHIERAKRYFQLSLQYAVIGSQPIMLVVMGKVATGKSFLAEHIANRLGWKVFSSDRIRKEIAGIDPFKRTGPLERQKIYSKEMSKKTYQELITRGINELHQNRGVVLDATFGQKEQRKALLEKLKEKDQSYLFIELVADTSTREARLEKREFSPSVSDARLEDLQSLDDLYEEPLELPQEIRLQISSKEPFESSLKNLFQCLCDRHLEKLSKIEKQ
ncbi:AAA family ATPase [Methylacidiphilum caldifontis]|uniref:bifunctional aminoglycoside phosphotransferase/ATP-binding protein n=1 Tax=Methylacidiphilum caldifontis TaxID=2795386 RepID=UPI001A8DD8C0|nr:AAA family ATPase [Methylacidiphilum caldifontis]QSR89407.1 AAA family ATPase [Methylacidiphilum caldifontis]